MHNGNIRRYFRHGTLTQMRVFEAVARHANFTRAAEELHMAQPTVSVHVKKLSETMGAPLIEQLGKRLRLTAAGEQVYAACKCMFQSLSDLETALADLRGLKAGKLRIAATTAGEYLMPRLLAHFVQRHPTIELSLHVAGRQSILERLKANADHLYLLTSPPDIPPVVEHPIFPNPLVAVAAADHPLAREQAIPFTRFAREPMLMREAGSGTRLAAERAFAAHGLQPVVRMELNSNESIKEAVVSRLGVALMYRAGLGFSFDPARLAILNVTGLPSETSWQLVHPAATRLPSIAQTFVEFARAEAPGIFSEQSVGWPGLPAQRPKRLDDMLAN